MPDQMTLFDLENVFTIAPKHTTHVGGKGEYLHDWYAYLEGYSSEFVRAVYEAYMPDSKLILDPFAGVGTTPLTLALSGIDSVYCEINPAMRRVINKKLIVASLPKSKKESLCYELLKLADQLLNLVKKAGEDGDLQQTYSAAFKSSKFFYTDSYSNALKLRSVNDNIVRKTPLLGAALEIAVISKLVECSKLKRAGDVRYKTEKELAKGIPDLIESVSEQLRLMAMDCRRCPEATGASKLLIPNAKLLSCIDPVNADGLITSPPYLNGTNYFRNTKLELWYMRNIVNDKSLRAFRDEVVTSGINDVTKHKGNYIHSAVSALAKELSEKAYDQRISRMVAGYFDEMSAVLNGAAYHLIPGAKACIDIGDSVYAGIHVPTHEILSEIADEFGFKTVDIITLRERRSRDQSLLSQSLLLLERKRNFTPKVVNKHFTNNNNIESKADKHLQRWEMFKDSLPHMKHPYSKRNWGNELHSVCSYQGKLKPALAYHLINTFTSPGDKVLDPFSGSGTIPFEAALNGRIAFGLDIGLLATVLSNAKLMTPDTKKVNSLMNRLEKYINEREPSKKAILDSKEVKFNKTIPEYFHEDTLRELLCARDFFSKNKKPESAEWSLVLACMLHVLHGNRPYALSRRSHPITPYAPSGEFIYKNLIKHLWNKVNKSLNTDRTDRFIEGHCYLADILQEWPKDIRSIDVIITSPPFFDSTKFYMTNWMRYWFCGWTRDDFNTQPKSFVEVLQKQSFDVYDFIFKICYKRLKKGGLVIFHLGHSDKCNMLEVLLPYAENYFTLRDAFTESVEHCESHGIADKGGVKGHQYLILEK
jgi:DNA modification methylase